MNHKNFLPIDFKVKNRIINVGYVRIREEALLIEIKKLFCSKQKDRFIHQTYFLKYTCTINDDRKVIIERW